MLSPNKAGEKNRAAETRILAGSRSASARDKEPCHALRYIIVYHTEIMKDTTGEGEKGKFGTWQERRLKTLEYSVACPHPLFAKRLE